MTYRGILFFLLLLAACGTDTNADLDSVIVAMEEQRSGTRAQLIAVSVVSERVVWVSGAEGTWLRTTDGGATWRGGSVPGAERMQFRDVHGVDANTAFLLSAGRADSSRIYVTRDAGATWDLQFSNSEPAGFYNCLDFWDPRQGLAMGDAIGGRLALLATTNGGASWEPLAADQLPAALPEEIGFAASGTCLVTRPGGEAWVVWGSPVSRLLHTRDYGARWVVDTLPIAAVGSIAVYDPQYAVVFGGDARAGSAMTRDSGATWITGAPPPLERGLYGGAFVPGTRIPVVAVAGPGGLAWSDDLGASWVLISRKDHWSVGFASPDAGWAVGAEGRITKLSGFGEVGK